MPTVKLTTAEWNVVLEALDIHGSEFMRILGDNIFNQLAEQEN